MANKVGGLDLHYEEPEEIPWEGLYHPKAEKIFTNVEDYLHWYKAYKPNFLEKPTIGILFSRHYWINKNLEVEDLLVTELEKRGFNVISGFAYSVKDNALGTKGSGEVIFEWFIDEEGKPRIDAFIKLISFFLATSKDKGMDRTDIAAEGVEILKKLNVPVFSPVCSYYKTIEEWEKEELNLDIGWMIALPEFEGVIEPL